MTWAQREGDEPWLGNDQIRSSLTGQSTDEQRAVRLLMVTFLLEQRQIQVAPYSINLYCVFKVNLTQNTEKKVLSQTPSMTI